LTGSILRDIEALFEQRHIHAHELAPRIVVDVHKVEQYTASGLILMFGTDTLIENLIGKDKQYARKASAATGPADLKADLSK
jgi:hypothetical protein